MTLPFGWKIYEHAMDSLARTMCKDSLILELTIDKEFVILYNIPLIVYSLTFVHPPQDQSATTLCDLSFLIVFCHLLTCLQVITRHQPRPALFPRHLRLPPTIVLQSNDSQNIAFGKGELFRDSSAVHV